MEKITAKCQKHKQLEGKKGQPWIILMKTIIENQRAQNQNTYMLFADAAKCFDKLWLKDSLLEMHNLGYDPNTLNLLYKMCKETDIIIRASVGNTKNIQVKERYK